MKVSVQQMGKYTSLPGCRTMSAIPKDERQSQGISNHQ